MTVVYPSTCSAGGDVFMLIWDAKTQRLYALNGSGRAPQGMTPELFAAQGLERIPERGPLTITVPGAVDGWFEALERRSEEHTSELQSHLNLVCRLLLEKKKNKRTKRFEK